LVELKKIAQKNILVVEKNKDKPCFNGHIILFFNFKFQNAPMNNIRCLINYEYIKNSQYSW